MIHTTIVDRLKKLSLLLCVLSVAVSTSFAKETKEIKELNEQKSVMVTCQEVGVTFI